MGTVLAVVVLITGAFGGVVELMGQSLVAVGGVARLLMCLLVGHGCLPVA
jgi:hypothetical protein